MVSLTNSAERDGDASSSPCIPNRLSKRCEYGIKASVRLARAHGGGYLQSREIAAAEELPGKFLESILLALRSGGILISKVGAGGGYRLARDPSEIKLPEIAAALATDSESGPATPGARTENGESTCGQSAIDFINDRLSNAYRSALGHVSLSDLVERSENGASESPAGAVGAGAG